MPLYAFIKIPGIENSESTDETYKDKWIPVTKVNLKNHEGEDDAGFKEILKKTREKRRELREAKKPRHSGQGEDSGAPSTPAPPERKKSESLSFDTDEEIHGRSRDKAIGTLVIDKSLDSTSPKLQKLCLKCANYDTDEYLEQDVVLIICRQIPDASGSKSKNQIYMAYKMKKCLLKSVEFDASDQSKLSETISISFEEIFSYMRHGEEWDSKGWDFVEGDEVSATGGPPTS